MLLATDHMSNRHVTVVNHVRQHEEWVTVRLHDDEILDRGVVKYDVTTHHVADERRPRIRHMKTQCAPRSRFETASRAKSVVTGDRVALCPLINGFARAIT